MKEIIISPAICSDIKNGHCLSTQCSDPQDNCWLHRRQTVSVEERCPIQHRLLTQYWLPMETKRRMSMQILVSILPLQQENPTWDWSPGWRCWSCRSQRTALPPSGWRYLSGRVWLLEAAQALDGKIKSSVIVAAGWLWWLNSLALGQEQKCFLSCSISTDKEGLPAEHVWT